MIVDTEPIKVCTRVTHTRTHARAHTLTHTSHVHTCIDSRRACKPFTFVSAEEALSTPSISPAVMPPPPPPRRPFPPAPPSRSRKLILSSASPVADSNPCSAVLKERRRETKRGAARPELTFFGQLLSRRRRRRAKGETLDSPASSSKRVLCEVSITPRNLTLSSAAYLLRAAVGGPVAPV